MPHQYYKILSVHGKKDIVKISGNSAVLKENVYKSKDGKVDYSKFTHILQRCLDTDYLMSVCKKNKENFGSVHPTKFSKDLFLGYSEAFISVKITKDVRDLLYLNGFEHIPE